MFSFLKKIDWATVGTIAGVSVVSVLTFQALASKYQAVNKAAAVPSKIVNFLP